MTPSENTSQGWAVRREKVLVMAILGIFLLINTVVVTRSPTVYLDEPEHCDAAVNLYLGAGFTSTAWSQNHQAFYSGYVPLYPGMLYLFFKLAGLGFFQARIFNSLLAAAAAFLVWTALRRSRLVAQPASRLLAAGLILSGWTTTLTFRTIRPDTTMFLVCSSVFAASLWLSRPWVRYGTAALASAFLCAAGLPAFVYIAALAWLIFVFYRMVHLRLLLAIGAGMSLGVAGLAAVYQHFGVLDSFIKITLPCTGLGAGGVRNATFLHDKVFGYGPGTENLFTCFFGNPTSLFAHGTMFDWSAALLFAGAVALAWDAWPQASAQARRLMLFILTVTVVVPPFLHFAGHYPSYYRWMNYMPLAILLPKFLEIHRESGRRSGLRRAVLAAVCLSLFMGVPLRTLTALPDWQARSTKPLDLVASQIARPEDIVISNYKAYFALRPRCKLWFGYGMNSSGEFGNIPDLPTNGVSLLCLRPEELEPVTNRIGGRWQKLALDKIPGAEALAETRYAMDFYRRADEH